MTSLDWLEAIWVNLEALIGFNDWREEQGYAYQDTTKALEILQNKEDAIKWESKNFTFRDRFNYTVAGERYHVLALNGWATRIIWVVGTNNMFVIWLDQEGKNREWRFYPVGSKETLTRFKEQMAYLTEHGAEYI